MFPILIPYTFLHLGHSMKVFDECLIRLSRQALYEKYLVRDDVVNYLTGDLW